MLWTAPKGLKTTPNPTFDPLFNRSQPLSNRFPAGFHPIPTKSLALEGEGGVRVGRG